MRLPKLLCTAAVAAGMAVSVIAAAPAVMTDDAGSVTVAEEEPAPEPDLHESCTNTGNATVVTPTQAFNDIVPTPIGAIVSVTEEDAGTYIVDLAGLEVGTTVKLQTTLDWDTPGAGDYDLVVNGVNALGTDQPEVQSQTARHCSTVSLTTVVFVGTPVDTLTLKVELK